MNLTFERVKRASAEPEFSNKVIFNEVDTFDKKTFNDWGISDAVFIDNKQVRTGPPPSYDKIKKLIKKRVKKIE